MYRGQRPVGLLFTAGQKYACVGSGPTSSYGSLRSRSKLTPSCPFTLLNIFCFVNRFQGTGSKGVGVKTSPKPFLDRWKCACKISSRLVQLCGFPLPLHKLTDRETDKQTSVQPFLDRRQQNSNTLKKYLSSLNCHGQLDTKKSNGNGRGWKRKDGDLKTLNLSTQFMKSDII